jgi:hypothetical protein
MMKIVDYTTVPADDVKKWIDLGWQPYGSAVLSDTKEEIIQAMVKYEEGKTTEEWVEEVKARTRAIVQQKTKSNVPTVSENLEDEPS